MATRRKAEENEDEQNERFVVLLRHGIAEDRTPGKADAERSLTSEGHARMKQTAKGLERAFPKAQAIFASPLLRAVQTALWVSKGYRSRIKVQTSEAISPAASTKDVRELLEKTPERRIIIVGHEPNLTEIAADLVGLKGANKLELKKGACYGLRLRADGTAVLEWILSPRILRKLGEVE